MDSKKRLSNSTIKKSKDFLKYNTARTNLLILTAPEIDRAIKGSKVKINSNEPKDLIKKYEVVVCLENPFYFDSSALNSIKPLMLLSTKKSNLSGKLNGMITKKEFCSDKLTKELDANKKASKSNNKNININNLIDNFSCHDFLSFIANYNLNLKKRSQLLENINYKRINISKRKLEHNRFGIKVLKERDDDYIKGAPEVKVTRKISCLKSNLNKNQFKFKRSITNFQQSDSNEISSIHKKFIDLLKKAREQKLSKAIKFIFLSKEEMNIKMIQSNYNYLHRLSDFLKFDKKLDKKDIYEADLPPRISHTSTLSNPKLTLSSQSKNLIFPTELFEILEFKGISFEGVSHTQSQTIKPSATLVFGSNYPEANCIVDFPKHKEEFDNLIDSLSLGGSILESPMIKHYAKRSDVQFKIKIESKAAIQATENIKSRSTTAFNDKEIKSKSILSNDGDKMTSYQSNCLESNNDRLFSSSLSDESES